MTLPKEIHPLSRTNRLLGIVIPVMLVGFAIIFIGVLTSTLPMVDRLGIAIGILVLWSVWFRKLFLLFYRVFYDQENFYLKNPFGNRKIDFFRIQMIQLISSEVQLLGFKYWEYKIDFVNEDHLPETVRFFTTDLSDRIATFQKLVQSVSPNAIIEDNRNLHYGKL